MTRITASFIITAARLANIKIFTDRNEIIKWLKDGGT